VFAARVTDTTSHPPTGVINGPGAPNVFIEGLRAAIAGDTITCTLPPPPPGSTHMQTLTVGSQRVRICGRAAMRVGDTAPCGATIVTGASRVRIG
jgi:uncharacterized Zn-binding protein involved in type VI secretion